MYEDEWDRDRELWFEVSYAVPLPLHDADWDYVDVGWYTAIGMDEEFAKELEDWGAYYGDLPWKLDDVEYGQMLERLKIQLGESWTIHAVFPGNEWKDTI